jgi:MoxR-like ATPase
LTQVAARDTAVDARDLELLARLSEARREISRQIGQRIVGQKEVVDGLTSAILAGGHVLLVGVPGLAKTLLIQTLADALDLQFSRIQFTPDLMPSDITGTELLEEDHGTGKRAFTFAHGPVFGVTVAGKTYTLPAPFFVLATQNPIEQEGTYHLPEAQLDRFMYELRIGYPSVEEEEAIVSTTTGVQRGAVKPALTAEEVLAMQQLVRRLPAPPSLVKYAVALARSTRPDDPGASAAVKKYVSFGAGPRAGQNLVLGAKARAAMDGRAVPDLEDVDAVAFSVMRHRRPRPRGWGSSGSWR